LDVCESTLFDHCSPQEVSEDFCKECAAKFDEAGGCELMHTSMDNDVDDANVAEQLTSLIPDGCWPCDEEAMEHCARVALPMDTTPLDCDACIAIFDDMNGCQFLWGENPTAHIPEGCRGMGQACAEKVVAHCAAAVEEAGAAEECRTAHKGDGCWGHVVWAMTTGIAIQPGWYPGLTHQSAFEDFQMLLHLRKQHGCPAPCQTLPPSFCHTSKPGEECYSHVVWAKEAGIKTMPKLYPSTLTVNSSFEDFQAWLHHIRHGDCQAPCKEVTSE